MDIERQKRVAENESVFRDVNERVQETHARFGTEGPTEFLCECASEGCVERVQLTLEEYERVRSISTHFVLVPGHEVPEVERAVKERRTYAVVEKMGAAAQVAGELDPRSA